MSISQDPRDYKTSTGISARGAYMDIPVKEQKECDYNRISKQNLYNAKNRNGYLNMLIAENTLM